MSKSNKLAPRKKIALELFHHILGHRSTRSLMSGDTTNVWKYIKLRIYPYPFCTSYHISSMKKKARSKNLLKSKAPFKWVFMHIITATAPKRLICDAPFSSYLLIVIPCSKIPKLYGIYIITIEEVMDWLDMFQSRFGKIDEFGC